MTEDGRDWGERCVDMYKIVDKVTISTHSSQKYQNRTQSRIYFYGFSRLEKEPMERSIKPPRHQSLLMVRLDSHLPGHLLFLEIKENVNYVNNI